MTVGDPPSPASRPWQTELPHFAVDIAAPDIAPWRAGNAGVPGFTTVAATPAGPHVVLLALTHGNELAGAIVLDALLRAGITPARGRLTLGFANLAAFDRFDPAQPTMSRFVDEDLNRVWDPALLDGPRRSIELDRARAIRPILDQADILFDLHSMLWDSDPLILSGPTPRGRALAAAAGVPELVIADAGHLNGRRMIDYPRFTAPGAAPAAVLVEAGQHWSADTVATTRRSVANLLGHIGMAASAPAGAPTGQRFAEVTTTITASTAGFAFVRAFRGGEVIARRNTIIALDGEAEIRTPYDNCMLVMPSLRPGRGHTAVRLARLAG
ncbi:MAG: succinylglutamate desuccinylase/aspartoacylase family protein [Alphaproteobacteria bacterium]|nr:succinylglutamate desuccinylase/aspartoacylase family protein [Alphaproteobacteria bacterium]